MPAVSHRFVAKLWRWILIQRPLLLWLALVSFVAGFYVLPVGEVQMVLFTMFAGLALLPGITWKKVAVMTSTLTIRMLLFGMSVWLLLTLVMPGEAEPGGWPVARGLWNVVMLLLFFIVVQRVGRQGSSAMRWLQQTIVFAALLSVVCTCLKRGESFQVLSGWRFQNLLVYAEGLNPVLTGLSYGFAGIIALNLAGQARSRWRFCGWWLAALLLTTVTLFTQSRCALLGLIVGTGILFATSAGLRRWGMVSPLLLSALCYALVAPVVEQGIAPLQQFVLRGDSGRFAIYSAVWCRMQDACSFVLGHGLFARETLPEDEAGSMAFHAHSMYVATFYHGGVFGLLLLFAILFTGLRRAWLCLHHRQEPVWLALLAFGMVGLMFDGSMPLRLVTITRIEPLLVLFPLATSSALAARLQVRKMLPLPSRVSEDEWKIA